MEKLLIVLSVVIFSLTSCEKMEKKRNKSYTTVEIDGVTYTSPVMDDWSFRVSASNQLLDRKDGSFHFEIDYPMASKEDEKIQLNLRIKENEDFETNKRYGFPSDPTQLKFYNNAKVTISDGDVDRYYYAVEGVLQIESVESLRNDGGSPYVVNGSFEFTAKEEFTGDVINVSNGTFHRAFFTRSGYTEMSNW